MRVCLKSVCIMHFLYRPFTILMYYNRVLYQAGPIILTHNTHACTQVCIHTQTNSSTRVILTHFLAYLEPLEVRGELETNSFKVKNVGQSNSNPGASNTIW